MRRILGWSCAGVAGLLLSTTDPILAREPGTIAGVEMGAVKPVDAYDQFSGAGGIVSPYIGYMLHENFGLWGHAHALGTPEDNGDNRRGVKDDDATWAAGATAGPRFVLPIGAAELWGTGEVGVMTGLAPHSSITDTSFAYTTGGGLNARVTDQISIGTFARWNHLFQRAHGAGEVRFISAGISLNYDFARPKAAPAPPPVAQAAPPPPPPAMKKKLVLRGVNFDYNKANIRGDAKVILDEAVATLKEEGSVAVVAEGHTDSTGSDTYNKGLSLRRANAVRDYLIRGGISASRISVEGMGESKPVASNDTEDGRAQNRRVELRIKE